MADDKFGSREVIEFLSTQPTLEELDAFLADLTTDEVDMLEAIELRIRLNEPVGELPDLGSGYAERLTEKVRRQVEKRESGRDH